MLWNFTWTNKQATSVGVKHLKTLEDLVAEPHQWPLCFIGIVIPQIYHFISFVIPSLAKTRAEHSFKKHRHQYLETDYCHFACNPLPVFIISATWPKEERAYQHENTMHKIIWKNMLENCQCILSLFLYFPLSITIRQLLGTGHIFRGSFDVASYVFPLTLCLTVSAWHNTDYCKSSFSFIQIHPCCESMQSSSCL